MTSAERDWIDAILQLGCIVCVREKLGDSSAEVHHMLSGGRRMGHMFTLPLCYLHHRSGRDDDQVTSRDQSQRRFEARYGKEAALLIECQGLVSKLEAT